MHICVFGMQTQRKAVAAGTFCSRLQLSASAYGFLAWPGSSACFCLTCYPSNLTHGFCPSVTDRWECGTCNSDPPVPCLLPARYRALASAPSAAILALLGLSPCLRPHRGFVQPIQPDLPGTGPLLVLACCTQSALLFRGHRAGYLLSG